MMEDLSGLEPSDTDWISPDRVAETLTALLIEIGRVYRPVMLANAKAVMAGASEVTAEIDGQVWTQQPFPYQAKCLGWLRQSRADLSGQARGKVDAILSSTDLSGLFA